MYRRTWAGAMTAKPLKLCALTAVGSQSLLLAFAVLLAATAQRWRRSYRVSNQRNPERSHRHHDRAGRRAMVTEYENQQDWSHDDRGGFSEFTILTTGSSPQGITLGRTTRCGFTELSTGKIGRVTTGGRFSEYAIPTNPNGPWASRRGRTAPCGLPKARTKWGAARRRCDQ